MNSTFLQAITYCKKDSNYFESGKPPLDRIEKGTPESPEIEFDVTYSVPPLELNPTYEMTPNIVERMNPPSYYQSEMAYEIDRLMFTCFPKNMDVFVIHEHCPIHNSFLCDCEEVNDDDENFQMDNIFSDDELCDDLNLSK